MIRDLSREYDLGTPWNFWLKPKETRPEKLRLAIEAILVQQSNWVNVEKVTSALEAFWESSNRPQPSWMISWFQTIDYDTLRSLIKPVGFYNQKATYIKHLVIIWDSFAPEGLESMAHNLLQVKGVGPETRDAILLYGFKETTFVIDSFTKRIGTRAGWFNGLTEDSKYSVWKEH
ncbi:MAG TPA: hypothetical protein VJ044_07235, partial [Candidatus Hodarchaeales archaeon]|nr:hypothetical protein [Candidatus Hodarchaeales archaeon]